MAHDMGQTVGLELVDGNKRVARAAMEVFLLLNGSEIEAPVDNQESMMMKLAASELSREELIEWLSSVVVEDGGS